jgi:dynamin 1-like protein
MNNGDIAPDNDGDDSAEELTSTNGIVSTRDGRSVSSTVHDRSASAVPTGTHSKHSSRRQPRQPRRPHSAQRASSSTGGSGTSPPTARETFLTYFFGQSGPGPIAGTSLERSSNVSDGQDGGVVPVGRDVSGGELSIPSGLMGGKSMDGSNAAFDMKSLGKHIEAVGFVC